MNKHNFDAKSGKHSFTLGVNEYSDLSDDEWRQYLLGLDEYTHRESVVEKNTVEEDLPDAIDWRKEVSFR